MKAKYRTDRKSTIPYRKYTLSLLIRLQLINLIIPEHAHITRKPEANIPSEKTPMNL